MTSAVLEIESTPNIETTARLLDTGPVAEHQRAAWDKFLQLPMPVRTDERWRFSNVKAIDLSSIVTPLPVDESTREDLLARSHSLRVAAVAVIIWLPSC